MVVSDGILYALLANSSLSLSFFLFLSLSFSFSLFLSLSCFVKPKHRPVVMKAVCQGVIEMLLELPSIHAQLSANGDSDTMAKESNGDEPMDDDDEEVEDLPPLKVLGFTVPCCC